MTDPRSVPLGMLSRRAALRLAAASLLFGGAACAPTGRPQRVIVIGAGIAGLAAARRLADSSHTVTVLEARPMRSRSGLGVIRLRHEIFNQRDELVMVMEHPFMARLREGAAA